jgi:hypothetical protein
VAALGRAAASRRASSRLLQLPERRAIVVSGMETDGEGRACVIVGVIVDALGVC